MTDTPEYIDIQYLLNATVGCSGNTIVTYTGGTFDFANIPSNQFRIEDIAMALANTCRYGGHCQFYSVAEHCVHCADIANKISGGDMQFAKHALLHDASEAYVGDMPKPLKNIMPEFHAMEKRIEEAIQRYFRLLPEYHDDVKLIDNAMLKAEKEYLFPDCTLHWSGLDELPDYDVEFKDWTPHEAYRAFMMTYLMIEESQ